MAANVGATIAAASAAPSPAPMPAALAAPARARTLRLRALGTSLEALCLARGEASTAFTSASRPQEGMSSYVVRFVGEAASTESEVVVLAAVVLLRRLARVDRRLWPNRFTIHRCFAAAYICAAKGILGIYTPRTPQPRALSHHIHERTYPSRHSRSRSILYLAYACASLTRCAMAFRTLSLLRSDEPPSLAEIALRGGLRPPELARLELHMLLFLEWRTHTHAEELSAVRRALTADQARPAALARWFGPPPASSPLPPPSTEEPVVIDIASDACPSVAPPPDPAPAPAPTPATAVRRAAFPLHAAAFDGDAAACAALLTGGAATVNALDDEGATALFRALFFKAGAERPAVLGVLLRARADVEAQPTGVGGGLCYRPLHAAARAGSESGVKLLLAYGAGANARAGGGRGATPLLAAVLGHQGGERSGVVDRLLAAGAQPALADERGFTPLHFAAARGRVAVVRALLAAGACPLACGGPQLVTPLASALYGYPERRDGQWQQRLLLVAQSLLAARADVLAPMASGRTVLAHAVRAAATSHDELGHRLAAVAAHIAVGPVDRRGQTAHRAPRDLHEAILELLQERRVEGSTKTALAYLSEELFWVTLRHDARAEDSRRRTAVLAVLAATGRVVADLQAAYTGALPPLLPLLPPLRPPLLPPLLPAAACCCCCRPAAADLLLPPCCC